MCGFETDLTADEGDILSVGADVFDKSNVDPVRLRNAQGAWMALINSCREITLKIVQSTKRCVDRRTGVGSEAAAGITRADTGDARGVIRTRGGDTEGVIRIQPEWRNLVESVVPALLKLTISSNLPPIMASRTRGRRVHTGVGGAALQSDLPTTKNVGEDRRSGGYVDVRRRGPDGLTASNDGELCHFDMEQAFLMVDINGYIYIERERERERFPRSIRSFRRQGLLNKAINGLVQAGRCWNNKLCDDMVAIEFE